MRLKEIREAKGISQRQAALALNLSPSLYNKYENGVREPANAMLPIFADFFGVTVDELLGREQQEKPAIGGQIDGNTSVMLEQFPRLSPEEQREILSHTAWLLSRHEQ